MGFIDALFPERQGGPIMAGAPEKTAEILLVEDNPGDVVLTRKAMERARFKSNLHVVGNGEDALSYLRKEGAYAAVGTPDLILLDLNLPRKNGREVLTEVKGDPRPKLIPVVVLTTSDDDADILRAYLSHANSYITKPVDLDKLVEAVSTLNQYWMSVVTLPPH